MLRQGLTRIAALVAVVMVAATLAGCGINNIPTYEQAAKARWSEVLSQYKRRADSGLPVTRTRLILPLS